MITITGNNLDIFNKISLRIIREQELIIGPLAWEEAKKVSGLQILDTQKGEIVVANDNPKNSVDQLVARYERLFGKASHEVCKESVRDLITDMSPEEVPSSLK